MSVSQSMVGLLLAESSSRRYPSSTASTSSTEISQSEHRLGGIDQSEAGNSRIVDATCEGRILSNTSSQRPLGSQGWGWEKFPLGGVFTKHGVMSPLSALPSRQVFSESVENENQIIGRYRADWNFRITYYSRGFYFHTWWQINKKFTWMEKSTDL